MNIVVLDGLTVNPGDNPWDEVASLGDLTVHPRTDPSLIVERATPADVILTNKTPLAEGTLTHLPRVKFISVLATGYNAVDTEAARRRGIAVSNVPEYGTDSVAQHAFALLLELASRVGEHDRAVKEGLWSASPDFAFWKSPPAELSGKTLGIVGYGRIGRRVAEIGHALGMKIVASSRSRKDAPPFAPFSWASIPELFASADVVSLNCVLTAENAGFVDRGLLASMKRSAFLINTARGALVNERDLAEALEAGVIAGAGVDVVSEEPIRPENPLLKAPRCVITGHMAWASLGARRRLMHETALNIESFLAGRPRNLVN